MKYTRIGTYEYPLRAIGITVLVGAAAAVALMKVVLG